MRKLSPEELATRELLKQTKEIATTQKNMAKTPAGDMKAQAAAKVAYDKAQTALELATINNTLLESLTSLVQNIESKPIEGYKMKIIRDAEGKLSDIDMVVKYVS